MSRLNTFLAGIKVLDLSQYIPGPMTALIFADMGAEVLKIEPPQGDEMRHLGPKSAAGEPVFYGALNAGKKVRRLDLKGQPGRAALLDLAADYDVLIEGFRPGVMARLGLDYAVVVERNPRLIYCSISGFGAAGPAAAKAAHDGNYLATSGVLDRNGRDGPDFFDPPLSDVAGSLYAAITILGALHGRHTSGQGCQIDLGLADIVMPLQLMQVAAYGANGHVPKRRTTYLNGGAAYYQIYATADAGHVMLGAIEPKFWHAFCEGAGRADWIVRKAEPLPQLALTADVAAFLRTLPLDAIVARFSGIDCCLSPVLDLGAALSSDQTVARGLVRRGTRADELQALFPAFVDGQRPNVRVPLTRLADSPSEVYRRAGQ